MDTERELAELRTRVAHLEALVERAVSAEAPTRVVPETDQARLEGFSRRRMLRSGLGLSAAAVAGVGMLDAIGSSAAAADGDAVTIGQTKSPTTAASAPTRILNPSSSVHSPVLFQVDNTTDDAIPLPADTRASLLATMAGHDSSPQTQVAILGLATFGIGVQGHSDGDTGVVGTSIFGVGMHGRSTNGTGLEGTSTSGPAMVATSTSGRGILASSSSGEGIRGTSTDNIGVVGDCPDGFGVVGNSSNGTGLGGSGKTGVLAVGGDVGVGSTSDSGIAVQAISTEGTGVSGRSQTGTGVSATSANAVGARLQGGAAAVRLVPQTAAGSPTTGKHQRGEMLVDSKGRLWLCAKAGTPGTWKKLAFV